MGHNFLVNNMHFIRMLDKLKVIRIKHKAVVFLHHLCERVALWPARSYAPDCFTNRVPHRAAAQRLQVKARPLMAAAEASVKRSTRPEKPNFCVEWVTWVMRRVIAPSAGACGRAGKAAWLYQPKKCATGAGSATLIC